MKIQRHKTYKYGCNKCHTEFAVKEILHNLISKSSTICMCPNCKSKDTYYTGYMYD